jgi:hypothetical protein
MPSFQSKEYCLARTTKNPAIAKQKVIEVAKINVSSMSRID